MEWCAGNADDLAGSLRARGLGPGGGPVASRWTHHNIRLRRLWADKTQSVTIPGRATLTVFWADNDRISCQRDDHAWTGW